MSSDAVPHTTTIAPPWWRRAVVYQVYPRSFADADGDGTGDVEGIRSRLPYLRDLGVDAIWISPWYPSPLNDGGYDVADYRDIDPRFGTLTDAERLIADARDHGIHVIVDIVPNHTSSEHRWFRAAIAAGPGSPERDRYIFKPGRGPDGTEPPNNWTSVFGGSAWERVDDGEWYLHLFDPTQPDLNWENEEVRAEFDDIFRFWIDRGVDGFRIDVSHSMIKDPAFPDVDDPGAVLGHDFPMNHPHWDREGVHEINRRWRRVLDAADRDVMMVAEAWVRPERRPDYLRPDEYHQSFNFDFLEREWDIDQYRAAIDASVRSSASVGSTTTWVLSNHDVMRHTTRFGLPAGTDWRRWPLDGPHDALDPELGLRRARAAALVMMALPGSVYIYEGEELGLPDVWDLPPDVLDDPVWENSGHQQKGRDGCRVPIPWTTDGPSFGFGPGEPWLPQPRSFGQLSVAAQTDDDTSTLELYRTAIALRRERLVGDEQFDWLDLGPDALAFRRASGVLSVTNFGSASIELPDGDVLLASGPLDDRRLPTDTTAWLT